MVFDAPNLCKTREKYGETAKAMNEYWDTLNSPKDLLFLDFGQKTRRHVWDIWNERVLLTFSRDLFNVIFMPYGTYQITENYLLNLIRVQYNCYEIRVLWYVIYNKQ